MGRGLLIHRWNALEAIDLQAQSRSTLQDEGVCLPRRDAGLLRLLARIHLDQQARATTDPVHGAGESLGQLRPVQAVDGVEQRDCVFGLVGLKRSDEAQRYIRKLGSPRRPALRRLLDAIFAEKALSRGQHRIDTIIRLLLGDGAQRDRSGIATARPRRHSHAGKHVYAIGGDGGVSSVGHRKPVCAG